MANKIRTSKSVASKPCVLARDTYKLSDAYISEYNKTTYKHEVELISLSDLMYKFSVTNTEDYKKFKDKDDNAIKNKFGYFKNC